MFTKIIFKSFKLCYHGNSYSWSLNAWYSCRHLHKYKCQNVELLHYIDYIYTWKGKNSCCEIRVWWVWLDFIFASSVPDLGGKARVGIVVDFVSILKLVPLSAGLWMGRPWEWCFICQNTDFISIKEFFVFWLGFSFLPDGPFIPSAVWSSNVFFVRW